jgi:uncharacterized protein
LYPTKETTEQLLAALLRVVDHDDTHDARAAQKASYEENVMLPMRAYYRHQPMVISEPYTSVGTKGATIMAPSDDPSAHLRDHSFISLTTFRTNGEAVPTPVTFGEANGSDKLYVVTGLKTGKMKRLQHNPAVALAPCDQKGMVVGAAVQGHARILSTTEGKALRKQIRFRTPAPILFVFNLLRKLRSGGNVYLEISLR